MITSPDYNNCIVNFSNSLLNHYGLKTLHSTLPVIDRILKKNYRNIVVIVLDGLGMDALNYHLQPDDFLRKNLKTGITSVFPSSSTPGLTALETSQMPIEHGWLGDTLFFKQEYKIVNCVNNTLMDSEEPAGFFYLADYYLPITQMGEKLAKLGKVQVNKLYPLGRNSFSKIDSLIARVKRVCQTKWKTFTFAYWVEPGTSMMEKGSYHPENTELIKALNDKIEVLCNSLTDSVIFVTSTHGLVDVDNIVLSEDEEFTKMLQIPISMESRAVSFYVKPEFIDVFKEKFHNKFGDDFQLYSKEEAINKNIFGNGTPNVNLTGIGDFIAVATGNKAIVWSKDSRQPVSACGGLTAKEVSVPLIVIEKRGENTLNYERRK